MNPSEDARAAAQAAQAAPLSTPGDEAEWRWDADSAQWVGPSDRPPNRAEARRMLKEASGDAAKIDAWNTLRDRLVNWQPDLSDKDDSWNALFIKLSCATADGSRSAVHLWRARLEHADLTGARLEHADLTNAHLEGAKLMDAHLEGAKLMDAHLEGAKLMDAHLEGAYLMDAHLEGANLWLAHLEAAKLMDAHLEGATLMDAHLEGAKLWDTHLEGAHARNAHFGDRPNVRRWIRRGVRLLWWRTQARLWRFVIAIIEPFPRIRGARGARERLKQKSEQLEDFTILEPSTRRTFDPEVDFTNADLRGCRGLVLNGQNIRGARFDPNHDEPYCILRRAYTGPLFAFHLLFLLVFLAPYVVRAALWRAVAVGEARARELLRAVEAAGLIEPGGASAIIERASVEMIEVPLWRLVLGWDKGWWFVAPAAALIVYNACRALMTWHMSPLRDAEERSGHAPLVEEYWWCFALHRLVMRWFFGVAVIWGAWTLCQWLAAGVAIPQQAPPLG